MQNKLIIGVIFILLITLQGCETVKGAAKGLKKDINSFQDENSDLNKADAWMQENLW